LPRCAKAIIRQRCASARSITSTASIRVAALSAKRESSRRAQRWLGSEKRAQLPRKYPRADDDNSTKTGRTICPGHHSIDRTSSAFLLVSAKLAENISAGVASGRTGQREGNVASVSYDEKARRMANEMVVAEARQIAQRRAQECDCKDGMFPRLPASRRRFLFAAGSAGLAGSTAALAQNALPGAVHYDVPADSTKELRPAGAA